MFENFKWLSSLSLLCFFVEPKKKPSRFFMEQWYLAQSPPDSPSCSPDTLRQVVIGMECGSDANTLHLHLFVQEAASSLNAITVLTCDLL